MKDNLFQDLITPLFLLILPKYFFFGGMSEGWKWKNDLWEFDLETRKWKEIIIEGNDKPSPRKDHSAVIKDDKIFIFGGQSNKTTLNDLWVFDYNKKQWSNIPTDKTFPSARYGHSAVIYNNKIYIFGGQADGVDFGDIWEFDIEKKMWKLIDIQSHLDPRHYHSAVVWKDQMIVCAGYKQQRPLRGLWVLDLISFKWSKMDLPHLKQRSGHTASINGDIMFVFSGEAGNADDGYESLCDTAIFHTNEKKWEMVVNSKDQPKGRLGAKSVILGDSLVIFGGIYVNGKEWKPDEWFNDVWILKLVK